MKDLVCDRCGERFNSQMNHSHHVKFADCEPSSEQDATSSNGSRNGGSRDGKPELKDDEETGVTGTVEMYDAERGFGFITTADITRTVSKDRDATVDVFVHISNVDAETLSEGDRVEFDVVEGDEGLNARNTTVLEKPKRKQWRQSTGRKRTHGFGSQKSDEATGWGKASVSEHKIESFKDDRKFR